jgi:hypothetical protein
MIRITKAERRILREHRGSTVEARSIRSRLRADGLAYCRGCSRVKNIAADFYVRTPSRSGPQPHQARCKSCCLAYDAARARGERFRCAAPFVAADEATRRARTYRNVVRSLAGRVEKSRRVERLARFDEPVASYKRRATTAAARP